MSSKKTTTTNSTQASTQQSTPTVPSWFTNPTMTMAGQVSNLVNQGPGQFTPSESALQQQAVTNAGNLTLPGAYGQASTALNNIPQVTGQSVLDNLSSYYNPFESSVIDPVLQQYDYQAGQTRAAQAAQAAAGGAFGGSRYGVQEANTEGQLAMGRASTQGGLLNQMYSQAAGMSAQDAANRQAAEVANQGAALQQGGLLTSLGTQQNAAALQNASLQDQVGAQQTDLENAIKQYPMQYQAQLESLLSGLNPQMYTGSTTSGLGSSSSTQTQTQDPGLLGYAGMALSGLSMLNPATAAGGGLTNLFSSFRQSPGALGGSVGM